MLQSVTKLLSLSPSFAQGAQSHDRYLDDIVLVAKPSRGSYKVQTCVSVNQKNVIRQLHTSKLIEWYNYTESFTS